MSDKSAIETSSHIDVEWVWKLWASRTAKEMSEILHGFLQLSQFNDSDVRDEVCFIKELCWKKRDMELDEAANKQVKQEHYREAAWELEQ